MPEKLPPVQGSMSEEELQGLNQEKWLSKASGNMTQAKNLTKDMLHRLRQNEAMEAASKNAAMEAKAREAEREKAKVKGQAKAHNDVISTSFQCMQDIEEARLQTEDCLTKLRHERMAGFAALEVCNRRMQLRETRPDQEKFQDTLADALNRERSMQEAARKEIFDLEDVGKTIVDDLVAMRVHLSRDTGERRLEMMHDAMSLKPQVGSTPGHEKPQPLEDEAESPPAREQEASAEDLEGSSSGKRRSITHGSSVASLPAVASASPPEPEANNAEAAPIEGTEGGPSREEGQKMTSAQLIKATLALLERAAQFREKTLIVIQRVKHDGKKLFAKVEATLARRCVELAELKRKLEIHALDVEAAIVAGERAIERSKKRLDPKDKVKKEKLAADEKVLEELRANRKSLQNEIRNKFAALDIDNMCRRVTPAKASESKRVQRTHSAPAFRKKVKDASEAGRESLNSTMASGSGPEFGVAETDPLDEASTRAASSLSGSVAKAKAAPQGQQGAVAAPAGQ